MKEIVNDGFAKVVKPYMDAQDKKSREIIAPVEVSPAEAAHSAGDQIIFNGILYDVIAPIAINDALSTSGAGANISAADNIEAQIKATKSQIQTAAAQAAAQTKSTQEMIAPVEEDETDASRAYAIGDQLILDGVLYNVIDAIAQHGIITSEGAGANIEEADNVTDQLSSLNGALTNKLDNEIVTRSALGAKNRLPITLALLKQTATAGTWANNVYTESGIDFTINTDASDYVTSIIVSGTASGVATINLLGTGAEYVANDFAGMILTGCPSGGGNDNFRTVVHIGDNQDGTGHTAQYEDGAGVTINTNSYVRIYIRIASGTDLTTPITFYPMIRLATDTDPTYQPYAKTNKELTDDVIKLYGEKLSVIKENSAAWHHTANITCDLNSGGLAYLFTNAGIVMLNTSSNSISMRTGLALEAEMSTYFKAVVTGLSAAITVWAESTFETSKNALWSLVPINGNWTMTF